MPPNWQELVVRRIIVCTVQRDAPGFQPFQQPVQRGGITTATFPVDEALARAIKSQPDPQLVLFFLGRQSQLLEGALFEGGEVGGRIPAEAGAQDPGVVALFQAGSGFAPFGKIDGREVLGADWGEAGQRGGEDADGAAHDQAWRGNLAAGGASLMVALGAEELLQIVVGRRQAGNPQIMEQTGAVAVGDLEEAVDGIAQGAAGIPAVAPVVEQAGGAGLDVIGRAPGCVLQDAGRGMDPAEAPPNVRPQRPGPVQTLGEQGPKLLQLRWQISPFSSIRPRLASTASSRSCSRKPAASSGGRPSSVRALRTAAQ